MFFSIMRYALAIVGLFAACLVPKQSAAQGRLPAASLYDLQLRAAQGSRWNLQVQGVYLNGSDARYLVAPVCAGLGTRIEFVLKNQRNWNRLARKSKNSKQTLVVFDGEFYATKVRPNAVSLLLWRTCSAEKSHYQPVAFQKGATSMAWFYEIRSADNAVLKRDGGFADVEAAKSAARLR